MRLCPELNHPGAYFTMSKRGPSSPSTDGTLIKRAKASPVPSSQIVISSGNDERSKGLIRSIQRTSNLEAPIVSLSGAHGVRIIKKLEQMLV